MTAPETRAAAHAYATATCSGSRNSRTPALPQVSGLRTTADETRGGTAGSPEVYELESCIGGAQQRPSTSASAMPSDAMMGGALERRPFTAEGSSVHATALRQLERDQMQQV